MPSYRRLSGDEIQALEKNLCRARDWNSVHVQSPFDPSRFREAYFSGDIRLGCFNGEVLLPGSVHCPSGVYHAHLHNCTVGDNALVRNIGTHVSNYDIGPKAVVEDVGILATEGHSGFGNGTRVHVMNEGGGREIELFDYLSAQTAYLWVLHRHDPGLVKAIEALARHFIQEAHSNRGSVGGEAYVANCLRILNVRIGPHAEICGCVRLSNGSVHSQKDAPTFMGEGVIAEHFIVQSASQVKSHAQITNCFVGQGVKIRQQFSGENSLFFANAELYHGEACSAFFGPFSVSHHKSSLLLAGLYSFYNAGSGSNFSNHMYKLGPVHQGLLERGCKTGSHAYLFWPSRIGAFTIIIGMHPRQLDTSAFPFSILIGDDRGSTLLPGANLFTVGTRRDQSKWRDRDRRPQPARLDCIRSETFSPYTVGRMIRAYNLLDDFNAKTPAETHSVSICGAGIPRSRLERGAEAYDLAIRWYLTSILAGCIEESLGAAPLPQSCRELLPSGADGTGPWMDLCGLLLPRRLFMPLAADLRGSGVTDIAELNLRFRELRARYPELERQWAFDTWLDDLGITENDIRLPHLVSILDEWESTSLSIGEMILDDAAKEFSEPMRYGYCVDEPTPETEADYRAVRGSFDSHPFVVALREEKKSIQARCGKMHKALERILH
jgi:hypothetical protein